MISKGLDIHRQVPKIKDKNEQRFGGARHDAIIKFGNKIISQIKSRPVLECFVEPGKSSQKKLALLCLMLWFYRYSITVALCGMVAVRETRSTLTVFSSELRE